MSIVVPPTQYDKYGLGSLGNMLSQYSNMYGQSMINQKMNQRWYDKQSETMKGLLSSLPPDATIQQKVNLIAAAPIDPQIKQQYIQMAQAERGFGLQERGVVVNEKVGESQVGMNEFEKTFKTKKQEADEKYQQQLLEFEKTKADTDKAYKFGSLGIEREKAATDKTYKIGSLKVEEDKLSILRQEELSGKKLTDDINKKIDANTKGLSTIFNKYKAGGGSQLSFTPEGGWSMGSNGNAAYQALVEEAATKPAAKKDLDQVHALQNRIMDLVNMLNAGGSTTSTANKASTADPLGLRK